MFYWKTNKDKLRSIFYTFSKETMDDLYAPSALMEVFNKTTREVFEAKLICELKQRETTLDLPNFSEDR